MDWRVFAFSAALAVATAVLFGTPSAWQTSQAKPIDALRTLARGMGGTAQACWRTVLTVAEVALSLILLVGAGKFHRTVLGRRIPQDPINATTIDRFYKDLISGPLGRAR